MNKNSKKDSKHFLVLFSLYIFFVLSLASISDKSVDWKYSIIFIIPFLFTLYISISKLLIWKGLLENKFTSWGSQKYNEIINWEHNPFKYQLKKKEEKVGFDRIILFMIFIIIPFTFFTFLMQGTWQDTIYSGGGSGTFMQDKGLNEFKEGGKITINPEIDFNLMQKISYVIGKELNLQIFDVCFVNNGTKPKKVIEETFKSKVIIDDKIELTIPFKGEKCYPFDYNRKTIQYEWFTSFEYPVVWRNNGGQKIPDYSANPINSKKFKFNYPNLLTVSFVLLISWWALCLLVIRVFIYLYKGLELNKEK